MLDYFIKHKKVKGVITVFLTIIYLSVYILVGVFVDGGRVRMAETIVEDVQQIATENAMSQYNRGLYEYYGLFGVSEYDINNIVNDVQKQIEESLGLNIEEDVVKSFILDVWTAGKSVVENADILNKEASTLEKATEYKDNIVSDVKELRKRFDPYGIKLKSATASYIDLSNIDAIRAQMRDEMRYSAYMLATENLFDVVGQFLEVAGGVNTVLDITNSIKSSSEDLDLIDKEYQKSLDVSVKTFNSIITASYKKPTGWEKVNSVLKSVAINIGQNVYNIFGNILSKVTNNKYGSTEAVGISGDDDEYVIETNLNIKLEEEGNNDNNKGAGLVEAISNKNDLKKPYIDFDNFNWKATRYKGRTYYYSDPVEKGEKKDPPYYHKSEHLNEVKPKLSRLVDEYKNEIKDIMEAIDSTKVKIDESIELNKKYINAVSNLLNHLQDKCVKANENNDKISEQIYAPFIESYLRQWKNLKEQQMALEEIRGNIVGSDTNNNIYSKNLINELSNAKTDAVSVFNAILNEIDMEEEDWNDGADAKLGNLRDIHTENFHNIIIDIVNNEPGIKTFQKTANGKSKSKDIFKLLKILTGDNNENKEENENKFSGYGVIKEEDKVQDSKNNIFDYAKYLKTIANKSNDENFENDDKVYNEFTEDNIYEQVEGIFSKATEMVANIVNGMFANLYDEAYILTNFRDYVHTIKYKENGYNDLTDIDRKKENVDTIFNKKFIENMCETKYFTDDEFKDIEYTPCEIEYILWGNDDIKENLKSVYTSIFTLRLVLNYVAVFTSPIANGEITTLSAASFLAAPIVAASAPLIFAIPQSCYETKEIFECRKVNFWNGAPENTTLSLFDGLKNVSISGINDVKDKIIEVCNNFSICSTEDLLDGVIDINKSPEDINIKKSVKILKKLISDSRYNPISAVTNKLSTDIKGVFESKFQAGYTFYLSIFLFINGVANKNGQIRNMQNIIQTNMHKAGQKNFDMAKTYTQISVDTKLSIKYVFMTQAFMKKSFSPSQSYNEFPINIKTAFSY